MQWDVMGEGRGEPILKIILFCVLAGVTLACHTFVERYEQSGPEMLSDHWIMQGDQAARAGGAKGELVLVSTDPAGSAGFHQEVLGFEPGAILKLSADMRCDNVQPGEKAWNRARLLLVQNDGKKDRWDLPHQAAALSGTHDWDHYQGLFTLGPDMQKMRVVVQLSRCTGLFGLKNIRLYPVTQTRVYTGVKTGILVSWAFFSVFLVGSCFFYDPRQTALQGMLMLAFIAIIIGTTMPNDMKIQVSNQVVTQIHAVNDAFSPAMALYLTKAGHFCFFVLFGLFLSMLLNREPALLVLGHILLLAGATEIAQFYIDGRSPLILDFVLDASGGILGLIVMKFSSLKRTEIKSIV